MIKQRRESIAHVRAGRPRRSWPTPEAAEIAVIEGFLPRQMSEAEAGRGDRRDRRRDRRGSVKDMGRVMALLKERHAGEIDMGKASAAGRRRALLPLRERGDDPLPQPFSTKFALRTSLVGADRASA